MKYLNRYKILFAISILNVLFATSCTKDIPPYAEISIDSVVNITHTSAVVYLNAKHDKVLTLVGLHYSLHQNFSDYDSISCGHGLEEVTGIAGLAQNQRYYVRGWIMVQDPNVERIITKRGTTYEFTTNPSTSFTDPRDGQNYQTVTIGGLEWFTDNLNYRTQEGSFDVWGNENNRKRLGLFYNQQGLTTAIPIGWRVPTIEEINNLVDLAQSTSVCPKPLFAPISSMYLQMILTNPLGFSIQFPKRVPVGSSYTDNFAPFYFYNEIYGNSVGSFSLYDGKIYYSNSIANVRCVRNAAN
jgi:uncharacterized protein (TIGR02145 family)